MALDLALFTGHFITLGLCRLPGDVLAIVQRIEARLNALAEHLGA